MSRNWGYTHIEFMRPHGTPARCKLGLARRPAFSGLSSKFGTIEELQDFVEAAPIRKTSQSSWTGVPGHFNRNDYGLAYYDGTPQFEYSNPNQASNNRWGTSNSSHVGKARSAAIRSRTHVFWIEQFHLDGLRVARSQQYAVSGTIDLGDWTPNDEVKQTSIKPAWNSSRT
ncbi:MAG: hypothetical protein U5K84_04020 [Alkalibacterium sp.]|nr:hypothetical protein [Alkalibacterium sp.]